MLGCVALAAFGFLTIACPCERSLRRAHIRAEKARSPDLARALYGT